MDTVYCNVYVHIPESCISCTLKRRILQIEEAYTQIKNSKMSGFPKRFGSRGMRHLE